jgi:deoxyadenosine kinase
MENNLFISIAGIIGAGKTTLAESLSKKMHMTLLLEPVAGNTMLEKFYADMKGFGFGYEIYLLNARAKQLRNIPDRVIQDRTVYEDVIFAKMLTDGGLIDRELLETYNELFWTVMGKLKAPDIIIWLDVSPEEALRRIRERGRKCEEKIDIRYLTRLYEEYNVFMTELSTIKKVIKIDYNNYVDSDEVIRLLWEK